MCVSMCLYLSDDDDDDGGGGDDYRFALLMMNDEWMIESSGAIKRDELQNKSKDGVKL